MERTESFGYWVRRRRKASDLTQAELARRVGCALDTIKKIESDTRRPSRQLAELLADHLAIPPGERTAFIQSARGRRSISRLPIPDRPLIVDDSHADTSVQASAQTITAQPSLFVGRERELASLDGEPNCHARRSRTNYPCNRRGWTGQDRTLERVCSAGTSTRGELIVAKGDCNAFSGVGDPYLPFREILNALTGDIQFAGTSADFYSEQVGRQPTYLHDTIEALVEQGRDLIDAFVPATALLSRAGVSSLRGTPQFRSRIFCWTRERTPRRAAAEILDSAIHASLATHCGTPPVVTHRRRSAMDR